MVDWEWVDRKRADGWSWEDLAQNPRAGFSAEPGTISPGRQLRTLSRARLPPAPGSTGSFEAPKERRWPLARIGWLVFGFLAPWAFLALVLPSPVGVYLAAIPTLGFLAAAAGAVLAFGLVRAPKKWTPVFRQTATIGSVAGLVVAGSLGGITLAQGCPVLSPFTTSEPGGWSRVPMGSWASGGAPVLFFYGSVACPYCAASSWAVLAAVERLGNVSGVVYDHSSSSDVYPNTPSVDLDSLAVVSPYVSFDAREATNDQTITAPAFGSCTERAYASAFDGFGAIPFFVLGGSFYHVGPIVDPAALQGLNASQVGQQLAAHQGAAYTAIEPGEVQLLAFLVWLDDRMPTAVATDPSVAPILGQIH